MYILSIYALLCGLGRVITYIVTQNLRTASKYYHHGKWLQDLRLQVIVMPVIVMPVIVMPVIARVKSIRTRCQFD